MFQKQPPELFYKNDALKNFTKYTGKHLFWSMRSATLLKKNSDQVISGEF